MRHHILVEIVIPDEAEISDPLDIDPATWMTSVFEVAFHNMGGPSKHPYSPKVVSTKIVTKRKSTRQHPICFVSRTNPVKIS